jgi:predicted adenine nucleotide alpha hydrolase (AANH) superfamily ATPase
MQYINDKIKRVSKKHLLKVLKDLHKKHEEDRRNMQLDTAEAIQNKFYCTGGRSNIKPLL